jgi:uncharacterized membrane protein YagU involved in acid resistance
MKRLSPLGALGCGLVAGVAGSLATELFFAITSKIAPAPPEDAFQPPEPEQRQETATQTVARRTVEGLLRRGPVEHKERAGRIVHYAFGAAWGGLYGLLATRSRRLEEPLGALGFGLAVWMASDNLILPVFRLAAWPHAYPVKSHAYAIAAHVVYGAAVWGAFEALQRLRLRRSGGWRREIARRAPISYAPFSITW